MAESIVFTGKRLLNGVEKDVTYIADVHDDGYCYFEADYRFRCSQDGTQIHLLYDNSQRWVKTTILYTYENGNIVYKLKPQSFSVIDILNKILHINAGGGSTAITADVESAVQWMINKATSNYITYSQDPTGRNLNNPDGISYDCSSFVITAFNQAGFDINATYTGDMRSGFTAKGWFWHPGAYFESSELQRGDILLNEALHTQVYIGDNKDVNCGATPARVCTHSVDNWGSGWDGFLRYGA